MRSLSDQDSKIFFAILVILVFMLCLTVLFDFSVARQIFGFIFLTFVPGALLVCIFRLNEVSQLEKILFSVGLSISVLIIAGFLLNELGSLMGLDGPLQLVPLMAFLVGFTIVGGIFVYKIGDNKQPWNFGTLKSNIIVVPLLGLLILTITGTFFVNVYGNNIFIILTLIAIPLIFTALMLVDKFSSRKIFIIALFFIAISLLLHSSLISRNIFPFGSDVPLEYSVFENTLQNQQWSSVNPFGDILYGRFNSMLSITILPTFYSIILNIDSTLLFKTMYPLLFAFVPLCLYQIWEKYIGKTYAFIAAFLFLAQQTFYTEMLGLNRQIVAELFFALLLLVIFNKKLKPFTKILLFPIFSFALITSHYGLAQIFLLFAFVAFAYSYITKQNSRKVTVISLATFSVIMFAWYIYNSNAAVFESILEFSNYVLSQFGDFFNPASRGQTVLLGLGVGSTSTIWNSISRGFAYALQFLIVLGLVGLLTKRVKLHFDKDYLTLTTIATLFLGALIVVPGLANTLNMTRFYHILLFFLAPLCVLGAVFIASFFSKHKKFLVLTLLLVTLVPYFLFQTNFVYELTATDSWSVPLSGYRMTPSRLYGQYGYIDTYSKFGAEWLSTNTAFNFPLLYADGPSMFNVLTCYSLIYRGFIIQISNITSVSPGGLVYLSTFNTQEKAFFSSAVEYKLENLSFTLTDFNQIYTNGHSQIFKNVQ